METKILSSLKSLKGFLKMDHKKYQKCRLLMEIKTILSAFEILDSTRLNHYRKRIMKKILKFLCNLFKNIFLQQIMIVISNQTKK